MDLRLDGPVPVRGKHAAHFEPLIKREGEVYFIQFHPIAMNMSIKEIAVGYNWILSDFDGAIGSSLHRHCTIKLLKPRVCIHHHGSVMMMCMGMPQIARERHGLAKMFA